MKIKHLLEYEYNEFPEIPEDVLDAIIESEFFNINWKKKIDANGLDANLNVMHHGGDLKAFKINDIKERSKPQDTPTIIHRAVNEYSLKKHGEQVRNMLFAVQEERNAIEYGIVHVVIPLADDYHMYYSTHVDDMFISKEIFNSKEYMDMFPKAIQKIMKSDDVKNIVVQSEKEFNYDMSNFLAYFHELMEMATAVDSPIKKLFWYRDSLNGDIDPDSRKECHREMKQMFENYISIEDSNHDLDGIPRYESFVENLNRLTDVIIEELVEFRLIWIDNNAKQYISTVEKTRDLSDIQNDHEILLPEGRYAAIPLLISTDVLKEIIKHYMKKTS